MKEPRPSIVRDKTNSYVVCRAIAYGHDITPDRIDKVRDVATRNPYDAKCVLKNVESEIE